MKNGICPKCGSKEIRYDEGGLNHRNYLSAGFFSQVRIQNYACVSCGYLENYIRPDDLEIVARKWARSKPSESVDLA
jgi:C4-type Zn-finger protein